MHDFSPIDYVTAGFACWFIFGVINYPIFAFMSLYFPMMQDRSWPDDRKEGIVDTGLLMRYYAIGFGPIGTVSMAAFVIFWAFFYSMYRAGKSLSDLIFRQ